MSTKNRLMIVAALLGVVSSVTAAQAQTAADQNRVRAAALNRTVSSPIDRDGWRFWNGNWDGNCFRTVDHLRSADACSR
jgi:hypothetical protein